MRSTPHLASRLVLDAASGGRIRVMPPSTSFADLGVDPTLVDALAAASITAPFPIQELTIPSALEGRDVCGKAKTGSGKTLAFGLPLLMRTARAEPKRPHALVLVPTRELALQVSEVLEPLAAARDLRVGTIYGGADIERQVKLLSRGLDVIVATPGRLIDLSERGAVDLAAVGILVVDEADRMGDMGFLPQVEWLLRHMPTERQTLLYSATLDAAVNRIVSRYMQDPIQFEVESAQVTVTQMEHRFIKVHELDKSLVTASIIRGADKALVFVRTKRMADRLVASLREAGVNARAIHGDLPQSAREQALNGFAAGTIHALVATDVAARGLDIEGLDIVVHYDPPEDHKAYLHRSGRTARAGAEGIVVTLVLWNEELAVERLQRRVGLRTPIVEMFSNDPRLADLANWQPEGASGVA
jgi:superfamily II DNA/RNA helicase